MREEYAARERVLEQHVYEIRDGSEPDCSKFSEFMTLPSELPQSRGYGHEYFYTINLDHEVLTMNHSIHWKLGNIPRDNNLWLRAIVTSIYPYKPTISRNICSDAHMTSLALELPEPNWMIKYTFRSVIASTDIKQAQKVFLTNLLAKVLVHYHREITRLGGEWSPGSFPFRELTFALISIASGQAKFHSFPAQR